MLNGNEIAELFPSEIINGAIYLKEEARLIKEYGVTNIDEVLIKQKQIIEKKKTRPEELAEKYPTEILELALEMKETIEKEKTNKIDLSKIPDDVLDMAIELGEKEKANKIDLSKIPIDVLEMEIGKKEIELVKESMNESKSKMEAIQNVNT